MAALLLLFSLLSTTRSRLRRQQLCRPPLTVLLIPRVTLPLTLSTWCLWRTPLTSRRRWFTRAFLLRTVRPLLKWNRRPVGTHLDRKVVLASAATVNIMLPLTRGPRVSRLLKSPPMPWMRMLVLGSLLGPVTPIGVGWMAVSRKSLLFLTLESSVWHPFLIRTWMRLLDICTIRPILVMMLQAQRLVVPGLLIPTLPRVMRKMLEPPSMVYLMVVTSPLWFILKRSRPPGKIISLCRVTVGRRRMSCLIPIAIPLDTA